ncbi:MAG: hypothetical protein HN929_13840 [Chloroflexi bacterium]|jgi:Tol biopolymer transport system component|nr:hypothetical protein [Chloroflexota bacterium]MBT7082519.1 hypothetical protein [Chloroflexota bacterium]
MLRRKVIGALCFLAVLLLFTGCGSQGSRVIGGDWNPEALVSQLQKIAFIVERDGYSDIYVAQADGSHRSRLTHDDTKKWDLEWSPDGRKIAYTSQNPASKIYAVPAEATLSLSSLYMEGSPFTSSMVQPGFGYGAISQIKVINIDGTNMINPTTGSNPVWSPDSSRIAYESGGEIWVVHADGSNQTQLTDVSSINGDVIDVPVFPYSSKKVTMPLGSTSYSASNPVWSLDGTRIMFSKGTLNTRLIILSCSDPMFPVVHETWVINANGTDEVRFNYELDDITGWPIDEMRLREPYAVGGLGMMYGASSPDGSKIVFAVGRADPPGVQIYVSNIDGSQETRLTDDNENKRNPMWSPKGDTIAFISETNIVDNQSDTFRMRMDMENNRSAIFVINADGTGRMQLSDVARDCSEFAWSIDGSRIAYTSWDYDRKTVELWVMNADGTDQTQLSGDMGACSQFTWAP